MNNYRPTRLWMLLALSVIFLSACGGLAGEPEVVSTLPPSANTTNQVSLEPPDTEPDLSLGAQIYAENCTRCHGETGAGDGEFVLSGQIQSIPDFTDPSATEGKTPADFYVQVTQGNLDALMPPFANSLSDQERWSVAMYVYQISSGVTETLVQAPASTEEAQEVADATTPDEIRGIITGQVVQGTDGAGLPNEMPVVLRVVDSEFNEESFEGQADAEGRFQFNDVPIEAGKAYFVSMPYQDNVFNSEFLMGDPEAPDMNLDVTVYEITDDPSIIQISSILSQVDVADDGMRLMQLITLTNTSDRLYMQQDENGHSVSVAMPAPEGAQFSSLNDTTRYIYSEADQVVYDTRPVMPGEEHTFHLIYTLPLTDSATFNQQFIYPYEGSFELFVDSDQLTAQLPGGADLGVQEAAGFSFQGYGTDIGFDNGGTVSYSINRVSQAVVIDRTAIGNVLLGAGIVLVLVAIGLYVSGRRSRTDAVPVISTQQQIQGLIKAIADLDDQYQQKQISPAEYKQERRRLKEELAALMKAS
ncbi:MAG: cytochrome c [Anaerolineae bacterium]|nr:cytochrome c [Anaerolineae bacterium]